MQRSDDAGLKERVNDLQKDWSVSGDERRDGMEMEAEMAGKRNERNRNPVTRCQAGNCSIF